MKFLKTYHIVSNENIFELWTIFKGGSWNISEFIVIQIDFNKVLHFSELRSSDFSNFIVSHVQFFQFDETFECVTEESWVFVLSLGCDDTFSMFKECYRYNKAYFCKVFMLKLIPRNIYAF